MAANDDNDKYKLIVVVGTGLFLLWVAASFQQQVSELSVVLGFIVGPILMYLLYKTMKAIFSDR